MANRNKKLKELTPRGQLSTDDLVLASNLQGTESYKVTVGQLTTFINNNYEHIRFQTLTEATYNITAETEANIFLIDASSNDVIITLDHWLNHKNQVLRFKRLDSVLYNDNLDESDPSQGNKVIVSGGTGDNFIDGEIERWINAQYESITIVSDGTTGWHIL